MSDQPIVFEDWEAVLLTVDSRGEAHRHDEAVLRQVVEKQLRYVSIAAQIIQDRNAPDAAD